MRNAIKRRKGITLIEVLIVITIIVILSGMIIANIGNPTADARDAKRIANLGVVQVSLELYYDVHDHFPKHDLPNLPWEEELKSDSGTGQALLDGNFLPAIPTDPKNDATYKYWYCSTPTGDKYALKAKLETESEGINNDYDKDWPTEMVAEGGVGCDCNDTAGYDDNGGAEGEQSDDPYIYCIRN